METLLEEISLKSIKSLHNHQKINILISPKYHCKLASKVRYMCATMKKYYQKRGLDEKNKQKMFKGVVIDVVGYVLPPIVKKFSTRYRRYMIAYMNFKENDEFTYNLIKYFIKVSKKNPKEYRFYQCNSMMG